MRIGALGPSATPSLSQKEKQYLQKLYYECNIKLPQKYFFDLALVLWDISGIKPSTLKKTSNIASDFKLEALGRVEFITRVGNKMHITITPEMAECIYTFYDLVKCLETEYLKTHISEERIS